MTNQNMEQFYLWRSLLESMSDAFQPAASKKGGLAPLLAMQRYLAKSFPLIANRLDLFHTRLCFR